MGLDKIGECPGWTSKDLEFLMISGILQGDTFKRDDWTSKLDDIHFLVAHIQLSTQPALTTPSASDAAAAALAICFASSSSLAAKLW